MYICRENTAVFLLEHAETDPHHGTPTMAHSNRLNYDSNISLTVIIQLLYGRFPTYDSGKLNREAGQISN